MIELCIIGALVAAIGGYLFGYRDGQAHGIRIMRDEFDEYRVVRGMGAEQ